MKDVTATKRGDPMKFVLLTAVFMFVVYSIAAAGDIIFDDFNDGNVNPRTWGYYFAEMGDVSSGDLFLGPSEGSIFLYRRPISGSVSIRTQASIKSGMFGLAAKWDGAGNGYFSGIAPDGTLAASAQVDGLDFVLGSTTVPVTDGAADDVMFQMDLVQDTISVWYWPVNGPAPLAPQLSFILDHEPIDKALTGLWLGDATEVVLRFVQIADNSIPMPILGDFDSNGNLDVEDIDSLNLAIRENTSNLAFDLDGDGLVDDRDRYFWVKDLRKTYFGDANLDGSFDTADFVAVLTAGQFEDTTPTNSTWATGDWSGDSEFTTADLVLALQDGGFERGPREAAALVPEPSGFVVLACGLLTALTARLSHRRRTVRLFASLSCLK